MSGGEPSSIKRSASCDAASLFVRISQHTDRVRRSVLLFDLYRQPESRLSLSKYTRVPWIRPEVFSVYQVLYRKWRTRFFADVAGQPQVTVTLKNELRAGRVGHAYLFTGSRGTGKTTCAKISPRRSTA